MWWGDGGGQAEMEGGQTSNKKSKPFPKELVIPQEEKGQVKSEIKRRQKLQYSTMASNMKQ